MNPAEVIMHVVKGHMVGVVLDLLGQSIGKPGKALHLHPHRELLALDVAGRDVLRIGLAHDSLPLTGHALGGTVAGASRQC